MDPGTLLGTISLGIQVSQGIVDYCNSFRGYNNETDALISSSDCLKKNLETIEEVMKRSTFHESPELKKVRDQLKNNVASSFEAIRALKAEYENLRPNSSHLTAKITMQNFARKAAWHFRKQSLPRLQRTVSDALRNLEIGVNTYQLDQIGFIRNVANQMKNRGFALRARYNTVLSAKQSRKPKILEIGLLRQIIQSDIKMPVSDAKMGLLYGFLMSPAFKTG